MPLYCKQAAGSWRGVGGAGRAVPGLAQRATVGRTPGGSKLRRGSAGRACPPAHPGSAHGTPEGATPSFGGSFTPGTTCIFREYLTTIHSRYSFARKLRTRFGQFC